MTTAAATPKQQSTLKKMYESNKEKLVHCSTKWEWALVAGCFLITFMATSTARKIGSHNFHFFSLSLQLQWFIVYLDFWLQDIDRVCSVQSTSALFI